MKLYKFVTIISIACLLHLTLKSQTPTSPNNQYTALEKIIYHSTHCNGTCPAIDLEIDSNYNVLLKRELWTAKGKIDKHRSGNFKGKIDPNSYFNLITTLISSDYANLKFSPIFCCDLPIKTVIIYANGKRIYLSSMTPPQEANGLISFLHKLGRELNIPPTSEEIKLEQ